MLFVFILLACILTAGVFGNVEKVIFVAPAATTLPNDASIDNLFLTSLNPNHLNVRTYLNASFPDEKRPRGTESWLLVEDLTPGKRYEVRVCWLATQPTNFWLYTHSLTETFEVPPHISSLSSYAFSRHASLSEADIQALHARRSKLSASSLLFLQIYAAADYFSLDKQLMENVPPVAVDIILDPYLWNVFPQSLVPTAVYITLIAVGAWFLSAWISAQLRSLSLNQRSGGANALDDEKDKKSR